jgi:beta-galactosidase GanA
VRIGFGLANPQANENSQLLDVEEGTFQNGQWVMSRRWNGDQTDYGLNLDQPTLLKVRLGTYR